MTEEETLRNLIENGGVPKTLRQGSSSKHAIMALQTLLHWLGFDRELKWERFGADGDYGKATTAAMAEFARRNGSKANGERASEALVEIILARYSSLEELKLLAEDIDQKRVEKFYKHGGPDRIRIAALQTLLRDLGFATELRWNKFGADGDYGRSTAAGVKAFGKQENIQGNGRSLTTRLAKRIVSQLGQYYGNRWRTPSHRPTPAPESLSIISVLGNKNRQFLEVSNGVHKKRFAKFRQGLFTSGGQKPAAFVAANTDRLSALNISESEIKVMIAVAENEGNLDAINTWDNAFLSFGLFQWTAGTGDAKGELPAFLARIKEADRDLFDTYCGQHGLDVTSITDGLVHGYFSLRGTPIKTAAAKAQLRQAPWAFYFWLAGQDPAVQALEIKHAIGRLDRFYSNKNYKVDGRYLVSELVTSEYGVGLILDQHVNRPAHVRTSLAKALRQTELPDPSEWTTEDERTLINSYLKIREQTSMTHPVKRARVTRKYLKNGTISDRRGSFKRSPSSG